MQFPPLPIGQSFHVEHLTGYTYEMPDETSEKHTFRFENNPGEYKFVVFNRFMDSNRNTIELLTPEEAYKTNPNDKDDLFSMFLEAWTSGDAERQRELSFTFEGGGTGGGKRRLRKRKSTRRKRKASRRRRY
jgi:hypothetical protein